MDKFSQASIPCCLKVNCFHKFVRIISAIASVKKQNKKVGKTVELNFYSWNWKEFISLNAFELKYFGILIFQILFIMWLVIKICTLEKNLINELCEKYLRKI